MKLRMILVSIFLVGVFGCAAFAAEMGKLTVVTDMDDAYIYIDGQEVAKSFIRNYEVEAGSHYIVVKKNDKKIYAQTVYIYPGQVITIPTSHFVDIRTSTPNRGALEVEAARIRETRGNGAFGVFTGTPLSSPIVGLSVKWWFMNPFGVQVLGYAHGNDELQETQFGARMLYNLGTKIMFEQPLDAYWAVGAGRKAFDDKTKPNQDYSANTLEFALGLEFGIGNLYFSLEGGAENVMKDSGSFTNMKASGGIHYYF